MHRILGRLALLALAVTVVAGCATPDGDPALGGPAAGSRPGGQITMARASWATGHMQAAITAQLLEALGYTVTDPAALTRDAATFYPAVARGQIDLWVNGWFPLHDIYLSRPLFGGAEITEEIELVGTQVPGGALQGYLVDLATAQRLGITSTEDLADPEVAAAFDVDGDGLADLHGCDEGWGCNLEIAAQLEEFAWGDNVEQVVGDYDELMAQVQRRIADGEPALFYTWTPNWTVDVLVPGRDVVWLESPAPADVQESTAVEGLVGCAGEDPCELGWVVNDIRGVAHPDFLEANPPARRLLELIQIPLDDIADQNARMHAAEEYTDAMVVEDAAIWITDNAALVEGWLEEARAAG